MGQLHRLTALAVTKAKGEAMLCDGGGLWLQCRAAGGKFWIFRYTLNGRHRWMGLGATHSTTLADARDAAAEARKLLRAGVDPLDHRRMTDGQEAAAVAAAVGRSSMTFDAASTAYIDAHRPAWRNAKHAAQWASTLRTYASPVFGDLPVAAVDTALVMRALTPIWGTKTETASRLRGRIESVLSWTITMKYRDAPNPAAWRDHLENLLPSPAKTKRVEHMAAMPYTDLPQFYADLRGRDGAGALALRFLILTAARSGEVRLARWPEINLDSAVWTIAAARMKAGVEHRVPLSRQALELLAELPRDDLLFTGTRAGKPLSDMTLTAILRRQNLDVTAHGFRSSFRIWAAEQTAFPREIAEEALAHKLPDRVEAAYRRTDFLERRRLLMQTWADFVCSPKLPASIVPLRSSTAA
ncbi:MAG: integrase arm-type DNA-binding domain-containing protein [Candidatus Accumulibacter sp.]|jgi:integrase|nr:integrase arm-type DNA-binding domain-containing protein [Candidatus Accumulibacter conexus]